MPRTLVLHLKRYDRNGTKLNRFIDYPMHALNMREFVCASTATAEQCIYDLCALIVHNGKR
jgi:hypothetical protein